ncbi:coiled-coil domain-containing protein 158-like isoform X2 [Gouania willdenowi]|uniref:coiled-coil domain-containing protein 158-like isoform X2 n=1 Tax=Gouania willdenowi TaxID=441366 RepID=UPI00105494F6|nr:coiled-coil domain-containing protein 158-like isoform X2 [Gouania willdenowi]
MFLDFADTPPSEIYKEQHQSGVFITKMEAMSLSCEAPNHDLSTYGALRYDFLKGTSHHLRFNSLTLDELSEELERRTKQTQRLQEEVDNETRGALKRFGCVSATNSSPESSCHYYQGFPASRHQQDMINPLLGVDAVNQECSEKGISSPTNETAESSINVHLRHCSDLQLNKVAPSPQALMMDFQNRLHDVQMEKDKLLDLRVNDSKNHVDQMEKMLSILEELQNVRRSSQQTLQETQDETSALNRNITNHSSNDVGLQSVAGNSLHFNNETETLQEIILSTKEKLQSNENNEQNIQERMQSLITDVGQEMGVLCDNLSSFKDTGCSLSVKLELLKILAERQTSLHQQHIRELETRVVSYKDKLSGMEQQLSVVQIQLNRAKTERDQSLQEAQEFQTQLGQLQRCCEERQPELQDQVKVLKGQLELTREQLHKAGKEREQTVELLREKEEETKQVRGKCWIISCHSSLLRCGSLTQSQCQSLQAERETLTLMLNDKEKMIGVLRLEMENNVQMTLKHRLTINSVQKENSLIISQLNQHKLEIQQLRAELDEQNSHTQASVTEQTRCIHEQTVEKQQLETMLELQKMQLNTLTKKHTELQRAHSCEIEEHRSALIKLQTELRSAHDELEQIRSTQGTRQVADGHALQVALDLQEEITARREQVDSMQSRIQLLKENVEKLHQEKIYQTSRAHRKQQELLYVREEKKQFASELEALRSKDQQLRERICELETLLHKISESFTHCQEFMQLQEQEYFRLKLQHALNLKEFQGQPVQSASNSFPSDVDSMTPPPLTPPLSVSAQQDSNSQIKHRVGAHSKRQCESPVSALRAPGKDQQCLTSENCRPHTDHSSYRRRSAPERERIVTFCERDETRRRRKTGSRTTHSNRPALRRSISERSHFLSSHLLSPGRKSPVYCLLTSDPTRESLAFER